MKVLGYVHTYNAAKDIDATIRALCEQTYRLPEILLVDNGSTDGTLDRHFPSQVTIVRNQDNLGCCGSVAIGMEHAIAHGYDWIYILDGDSAPAPDAIENLLHCYQGLSAEFQATTWWLSSLLREDDYVRHGCVFTPRGIEMVAPPPQPSHYRCDTNMWSGSLYRLDAVKKVGVPDPNYVLDWGDVIYGYEGMVRGYTGFIEQTSVVQHHHSPVDTLQHRRLGPRVVKVYYAAPIRCYYHWRNSIYFWMYKYRGENRTRLRMAHFYMLLKSAIKVGLFIKGRGPILRACARGGWDGLTMHLERRYRAR
jgi:GT2 family glycosyltransferase